MIDIHEFRKRNIQSSYSDSLEKGRKANIGEIRVWQGEKQQKQADGSWKKVSVNRNGEDNSKEVKLEHLSRFNEFSVDDENFSYIRKAADKIERSIDSFLTKKKSSLGKAGSFLSPSMESSLKKDLKIILDGGEPKEIDRFLKKEYEDYQFGKPIEAAKELRSSLLELKSDLDSIKSEIGRSAMYPSLLMDLKKILSK